MVAAALIRDKGPSPEGSREEVRESAKFQQILDGARKVFLSSGFDGASMNDIARAACVSKGTLYAYFESKEALFQALVRNEKHCQAERVCSFETGETDIVTTLRGVARRMVEILTQPDNVAILRMVVGVVGKFPEIGRAFYEAGPKFGRERLTLYLDQQVAGGLLSIEDTSTAASNFMNLSHSEIVKAQMFGMVEFVSAEEIQRSIDNAIDIFMRVYGPPFNKILFATTDLTEQKLEV